LDGLELLAPTKSPKSAHSFFLSCWLEVSLDGGVTLILLLGGGGNNTTIHEFLYLKNIYEIK